jgi:hypothetical protein
LCGAAIAAAIMAFSWYQVNDIKETSERGFYEKRREKIADLAAHRT